MMSHACRLSKRGYYCPECGTGFTSEEECLKHIVTAPPVVEVEPPTTPEPSPVPVVEFGEYVPHKSPTPRDGDTLLGRAMGYLSELLFWADIEGKCNFIDSIFPEFPLIDWIDNVFISIFQSHYNANYQKQYNRGADQGNIFNKAIFGWIDDAKTKMAWVINDVKNKIETDLINPIKIKLSALNDQIDAFEVKVSDFTSKIGQFDTKINNFSTDISGFSSKIDGFKNDLSNAYTKLGDLDSLTSTLNGRIGDIETAVSSFENKINSAYARVNDAEARLEAFNSRLVEANKVLNEHALNINDLIERVKTLEAGKEPFRLPRIPSIQEIIPK